MKKEFSNQFVVIYNYYNRVSYIVFVGDAETTHDFVANVIAGLDESDALDNVSSIDIVDLSQGFYRSTTVAPDLMALFTNKVICKFVYAEEDKLFEESDTLAEGIYYLPYAIDLAEHYQFDADQLADALYPTM